MPDQGVVGCRQSSWDQAAWITSWYAGENHDEISTRNVFRRAVQSSRVWELHMRPKSAKAQAVIELLSFDNDALRGSG